MGIHFQARHANIIAYLVSSQAKAPRLTEDELDYFVKTMSGRYEPLPVISSDADWKTTVAAAACESLDSSRTSKPSGDMQLSEDETSARLAGLRSLLSDYNLFALTVGNWQSDEPLRAFAEHAALSSGHHALILMAEAGSGQNLNVLDPFPAVALLAEQAHAESGVLFWSRSGIALFAPLPEAYEVYENLRRILRDPILIDRLLDQGRVRGEGKAILHLSDVHFGTVEATDNQDYLLTHLQSISDSVSRVIITGDLFDQPDRQLATAFRTFRHSIARQRGESAIVIPGNHDQKWMGNLRADLGSLANLEWSHVVVDDDIRCVFLCFDSSRDADWAKGKITVSQMREVATMYDTLRLTRPVIDDYLRIALIHHHPYSFETEKETIVAKALSRVGITDELLLRMDDADQFLQWCVRRGVKLILHGHKHVPRYVRGTIHLPNGYGEVIAVGCGSSLGVGGKPMSYNRVRWNPSANQWSVTFFADSAGGGFERQLVAVHSAG